MSKNQPIAEVDERLVESLMRETVAVTDLLARSRDRAEKLGLRIVEQSVTPGELAANADLPISNVIELQTMSSCRAPWRQRLVDAERGLAHALRSESTLLGYVVVIATASLAAGILQLPGLQMAVIGFLAVQAVLVELIRIAIRELAGEGSKATHVAAAASILAASVAAGATLAIIGTRLLGAL